MLSFLPSCYSSYGALDSCPGGTLTHCSCQPLLDAHFPFLIRSEQKSRQDVYSHVLPQMVEVAAERVPALILDNGGG